MNRYRIMEITESENTKYGKVWVVKANPAEEENILPGTMCISSVRSEIYEGTKTFMFPYDDDLIDEIEDIAKSGKLWLPKDDNWKQETMFDEKNKIYVDVYKYCENRNVTPNIALKDRKPLKQYLLEQKMDVLFLEDKESGKIIFECGKLRGFVSPEAAKKIKDQNSSIDDFEFAMAAKDGGAAIPCIMLASKKENNNDIYMQSRIENAEKLSAKNNQTTKNLCNHYYALLDTIKENIKIEYLADFDILDASFVLDVLYLLQIQQGKVLGIYRRQDSIVDRSFVATPYVHDSNAILFEPTITPIKKTWAQRFGLSKTPYQEEVVSISEYYSPKYVIKGILDRRIAKEIPKPSRYFSLPQRPDAIWQIFLLDNLERFLPKFDHGVYLSRKIICSMKDVADLPYPIISYCNQTKVELTPNIVVDGNTISIQCVYFNEWEGLVRWSSHYEITSKQDNRITVKPIESADLNIVLIKYDCGERY